jgi:hypothetical protein
MADPQATATEPPLGLVVEFQHSARQETLRELHRLAWNFSYCPVVITLEPGLLRVWSCCEPPDIRRPLDRFMIHKVETVDLPEVDDLAIERGAAQALHWINLVSGDFFRSYPERLNRNGRADHMLLHNLRFVRDRLLEVGLSNDDVCHDLLARVIFVQFLFDRKDRSGQPALNPAKLNELHEEGVLGRSHANLQSILNDYDDTYRLFEWLDQRFNGDLFPEKADYCGVPRSSWGLEKEYVKERHLALLADFIGGKLDMPSGQYSLWPYYSFDIIPLEFISSIYEDFVTNRADEEGIHYTPAYLVDYVLDRVLSWDGQEWDLKVLDPACGSGIFLVKAFQRLIYRWKMAHSDCKFVPTQVLQTLLEENLFGVDKDPHAVRVASFSLYLAMCDEIDPRRYWTQVKFPTMRGRRLINADFFEENRIGFDSRVDVGSYDIVVGNAPWGQNLITGAARLWASSKMHSWPIANNDIGTLFLSKGALLLKQNGFLALIQSANSLLFHSSASAQTFRQKLFTMYHVKEVINLAALRFEIFNRKPQQARRSIAPTCIIVLRASAPDKDDTVIYTSPKQIDQLADELRIVIEPHDIRRLSAREAAHEIDIWAVLMWGHKRDRTLINLLKRFPNLLDLSNKNRVKVREGIIFGDRRKSQPRLLRRPILNSRHFPNDTLLYLDSESLPKLTDDRTDFRASTDFEAFSLPQLIIKQGWQKAVSRFQARLTRSAREEGVLCNQSYITVHASEKEEEVLEAACLSYNSMIATYFLFLTSGRFATYRPEPLMKELLAVPMPTPRPGLLDGVTSKAEIDLRIFQAFGLKDAERALVEDLFNYTLPDFRGDRWSPGRQRTTRSFEGNEERNLVHYCKYFIRVLRAGFGRDKAVAAKIFEESGSALPYRLVAFELDRAANEEITFVRLSSPELLGELDRLNRIWRERQARGSSIYYERIVRIYDSANGAPTVFVLKPDAVRYWTRSSGLSDADEVALDLFSWYREPRSARAVS